MAQTIYDSTVIDLLTVAVDFCRTLEEVAGGGASRRDFLQHVTRVLPLLYVKATTLPEVDEADLMADDLPQHVSEDEYDYIRDGIRRLMGAGDDFLTLPDRGAYADGEAERHTVSEHLADIYQDVKDFVAIYADRNEDNMLAAIAQLDDTFRNYWGQKVVDVMSPMHAVLYGGDEADD